jgi:hypothetical protein
MQPKKTAYSGSCADCERSAQRDIDRVPVAAFEEVTRQAAVQLHKSNHRLDRVTMHEMFVDLWRKAPLGSRDKHLVALVNKSRVACLTTPIRALFSSRSSEGRAVALYFTVVSILTTANDAIATVFVASPVCMLRFQIN